MPRNSQGLYTPPLAPVLPGQLIESTWANTTIDDISTALTNSLPRDGSAPMTGPLTLQAAPPSQPRHAVSKGYLETFLAYATGMPIGSLLPLAGATIPSGFLLCDGQAVSRTTYTDLFTSIGTIYGSGDGSTTFNVPDMRDWFIRGKADSRPVGSTQAASFANHTHPLQDPGHAHGASQAAHDHTITTGGHNHSVNDPGHFHQATFYTHNDNGPLLGNANGGAAGTLTTDTRGTGVTLNAVGNLGGSADARQPAVTVNSNTTGASIGVAGGAETVPQNIAMNYVIKAVNDPGSTVALTGITSSDENVIGIDNTLPTVPQLVVKTNIAFGGVKLDASGKVPLQQMPFENSSLLGFFDASTGNNPSQEYPATTFQNGDEYIVSVAGTINVFNPVTETSAPTLVAVGSTLLYITGSVSSPTGWYTIVAAAATNASSVSFLPEGTIGATNVQSAIAELDTETQTALGGKAPSSAATATGTSFTPAGTIIATNVQSAIEELDAEKVSTTALIATNVGYTPFGNIGATNVQAAINELDTEKAPLTSPTFLGNPTAPTPSISDNDTSIATTAFVRAVTDGPAFTSVLPSQAVTTSLQILLTTEQTDPNSCFADNKFTPNVPGWYQVNLVIGTNQSDNWANAAIMFNGTTPYRAASPGAPAGVGGGSNVAVSALIYMNGTTDYLQAFGSISIAGFSVISGSFSASMARRG